MISSLHKCKPIEHSMSSKQKKNTIYTKKKKHMQKLNIIVQKGDSD